MVTKKISEKKNILPFYLKHKYWIFAGIFLVLYYLFFVNGKVSLDDFTAKDLEIKSIQTKQDFEDIIIKNIYDKVVDSCKQEDNHNNYDYDDGISLGASMSNGMTFGSSDLKGSIGVESTSLSLDMAIPSMDFDGTISQEVVKKAESVSFSETNIQKLDVDEGDILKQTKDYIFYFSKKKSKIYILKSPLNNEKIDLRNTELVFMINIPSNLTTNPELFVGDNRLVYIASKTSYNNNNTIVGIYDTSDLANKDVKLYKVFETKGEYFKSRLVNNKLYLISDYSISPFATRYCNTLKNNNNSSSFGDFISFFTGIKFKGYGLNRELYDELKSELESYSYKFNSNNLTENGNLSELTKFNLFYTNKDLKESIENLNFDVVSVVDIDRVDSDDSQTLFFGNLKDGEIHMTLDNLYLVNSYFKQEQWKCDYVDICYKEFASNNFISISKISYSGSDLTYNSTSVIPGKPLNQYSMDEDEGYFRIFTTSSFGNRNASLFVFDNKLKLIGQIENIKPGEEFKSARFIGDKAFLVTFRQIDPLFVIDLHVPSEPKIIGELQIPGYSTYLHPYGSVGNIDYLIGLGKQNSNVKVDLYEINYDKKGLGGQIELNQKYTYVFAGNSSETPAETNPRAFVWDSNDKILYLPIQINNYGTRVCVGNTCNNSDFYGLRSLSIDLDKGISLVDDYKVNGSYINDSRVGYYKSDDNKVLFFVNGDSINYFSDSQYGVNINF
ncbi:MAG: beta-propeller domain-containing protein [Candidatus Gracilibacteria bacterium]|nr:beta-propeller domain-containing protein [Candidatus Gracilibacteria bacterium]